MTRPITPSPSPVLSGPAARVLQGRREAGSRNPDCGPALTFNNPRPLEFPREDNRREDTRKSISDAIQI